MIILILAVSFGVVLEKFSGVFDKVSGGLKTLSGLISSRFKS